MESSCPSPDYPVGRRFSDRVQVETPQPDSDAVPKRRFTDAPAPPTHEVASPAPAESSPPTRALSVDNRSDDCPAPDCPPDDCPPDSTRSNGREGVLVGARVLELTADRPVRPAEGGGRATTWVRPDDSVGISSGRRSFTLTRGATPRREVALLVTVLFALVVASVWYASAKSAAADGNASLLTAPAVSPFAQYPTTTQVPTTSQPPTKPKASHTSKPVLHRKVTTRPHHPRSNNNPAGKKQAKPKSHKRSSHPKASTGLLTQTVVDKAFSAVWTQFAIAANAGARTSLLALATPSVVDIVEANRACNCGQLPISFGSVELTAPLESTYPISFAAEIDGAKGARGPFTLLAVLQKDSASASWQVAWLVKYRGTTPTLPSGDSIGTARPPVVDGTLTNPITLIAQLFESLSNTGRYPSGNIWVGDLNAQGTEPSDTASALLAAHKAAVARSVSDVSTYTATNFSPVFASSSGYLECGQISGTIVEMPAHGSDLVQPPNHSVYGPMLTPGSYASVTEVGARDFCVVVSLQNVVSASGLTGGTYEVTGEGS